MNVQLPGLVVDVEARVDKLEKALAKANKTQARSADMMERRARQSADRMRKTYGDAGNGIAASMAKLGKMAGPGLVAGLSVASLGAIVAKVDEVAGSIAGIGDAARRAGMETGAFQEWKFVAEQNRIEVDALVDSMKELNLRADEFVVTGKGPAAEAFTRLGLTVQELKRRLEDPSELMLEIIRRMEHMDRAAQIRIADEVFGGTGGERLVELLAQGEQGIRATMERAQELGVVLEDDVIQRAAEIDRKFGELKASSGAWLKALVVNVSDAALELADFRAQLNELFPSEAQGRAVLGDEIYDALAEHRDGVDAAATEIAQLRQQFTGLGEDANRTAASLDQAATLARSYGYDEAGQQLAQAATDMRDLSRAFSDGEIEGDKFAEQLDTVQRSASDAFDQLGEADRVDFSIAISELSRLGGAIVNAIGLAQRLTTAIREAANVQPVKSDLRLFREADAQSREAWEAAQAAHEKFLANEDELNAKTREQIQLEREVAEVRERAAEAGVTLTQQQAATAAQAAIDAEAARAAASKPAKPPRAGGGGGGRAERLDDFERAAASIRDRTRLLDLERLALAATAVAGADYAQAIDLARQKAELLNAALKAGRQDTPALRAEIDGLVTSYGAAAQATDAATDRLDELQAAQDQVRDIGEGAFVGLVTGAMTFKEALGQVLGQLAQMAASRLFTRMFSGATGGPATSFLGRLLGFAGGGFTGDGPALEPAGVVHRGEYVVSKRAVERIGVDALERLHTSALHGYAAGGYVAPAPRPSFGSARSTGVPTVSISAPVTVTGSAGTPEQNADLAKRMAREMETTMRGTVVTEIQRQMRPGNLLNRHS